MTMDSSLGRQHRSRVHALYSLSEEPQRTQNQIHKSNHTTSKVNFKLVPLDKLLITAPRPGHLFFNDTGFLLLVPFFLFFKSIFQFWSLERI